MSHEENRRLAEETLKIIDAGTYAHGDAQVTFDMSPALEGTELLTPEHLITLEAPTSSSEQRVEVTRESTQAAAERLLQTHDDVAILNFASARAVGGGFLKGSRAQEEELCRCSGLFRCLERAPDYYTQQPPNRRLLHRPPHLFAARPVLPRHLARPRR